MSSFAGAPRDLGRCAVSSSRTNVRLLSEVLKELRRRADAWMFETPVAPQLTPPMADLYRQKIARPMELRADRASRAAQRWA